LVEKNEIRVTGFGGQGIILSGYIIGKAACLYDKKYATLVQTYGPESRGSACRADLLVSTRYIDYPHISVPDVLIALSQDGYTKYITNLKANALVLIDDELVDANPLPDGIRLHKIPSTRIAEDTGSKIVTNMVMIGFFASVADLVSTEALEKAVLTSVPRGTETLNQRAFQRGLEFIGKE